MLAGIHVSHDLTLELARLLHEAGHEDVADALVTALEREQPIIALSIYDRENILVVLDDPPAGLDELRGVLLREHEWRLREEL